MAELIVGIALFIFTFQFLYILKNIIEKSISFIKNFINELKVKKEENNE